MKKTFQKPLPLIYNKYSKSQSVINLSTSLMEKKNKNLFYNRLINSKSIQGHKLINNKTNNLSNSSLSNNNSSLLFPNYEKSYFMDYISKNPYKKLIVKGLILKMQNKKPNIMNYHSKEKEDKKKLSKLNLELNFAYRKIPLRNEKKNKNKKVILIQGNKSVYDSIIKETILSKIHDSFRNDFIKNKIKNSILSELFN